MLIHDIFLTFCDVFKEMLTVPPDDKTRYIYTVYDHYMIPHGQEQSNGELYASKHNMIQ